MQDPDNLSALYRCAIQEDQRQKIRELDFGNSSSQVSAQCDINAIKGSGCYKCGSNDHFIKDCPLNRDNDKKDNSSTHGQQKHYNDYKSKSNDENSIEKSIQAVTDLLRSLLKQNKPSHTTFNKSTHRHSYTNKHSDHKPSYKHPNHRSDKSAIEGHLEPLYVARKFTFMHTEFISHHTKIRMITRQIADDINLIRSYLSTFTTG